MDAIQVNHNGDGSEKLSCSIHDELGDDEEMRPRIGAQYQAEIPPLLLNIDSLDRANLSGSSDLLVGLPILVLWIDEESGSVKSEYELNQTGCLGLGSNPSCRGGNSDTDVKVEGKYCPVPVVMGEVWSETEEAGFLLGLYVFGKNLIQVRKFVSTRGMGDILSFYYGKFYKSEKYQKWVECRKLRSRKSAYGQRIFTGVRQHEFLSRILPYLSGENESYLVKISKLLEHGKMQLEEYVNALKSIVGIDIFIKAVGIGIPEKDLTSNPIEAFKPNPTHPRHLDTPTIKPPSSLTMEEIVKFLTGDLRLSKSRSNDLFWEAVWPRLLARGWHSEQPKGHEHRKNSLVFLIPDVEKFSRKKLVKGKQYFDCVTDVLTKVASDPVLLELEDESVPTHAAKTDGDSSSSHLHEETKFTVVDTSLKNGGKFRIGEFTTLPSDSSDPSESDSSLKEPEVSSSNAPVVINSYERRGKRSRNLEACNGTETSHSTVCSSSAVGVKKETGDRYSPEKASSTSSLCRSDGDRTMINLNLPPEFPEETSGANSRRHSTRNRPLTTRALEALAYDYVSVTRKRKISHRDGSGTKRSRPIHGCQRVQNPNVEVDPLLYGSGGLY